MVNIILQYSKFNVLVGISILPVDAGIPGYYIEECEFGHKIPAEGTVTDIRFNPQLRVWVPVDISPNGCRDERGYKILVDSTFVIGGYRHPYP